MTPLRWTVLIVLLVTAYYGYVFWYASSLQRQQQAHLKWTFPLRGGEDLCADPLSDGSVVCSSRGTLYWVNPDGTERARYEITEPTQYGGYAWAAGGSADLCFVSKDEIRGTQVVSTVRALERDGTERWAVELETPTVNWLLYGQDACYALQSGNYAQQKGMLTRISPDGEVEWSVEVPQGCDTLTIGTDDTVFLSAQWSYGPFVKFDASGEKRGHWGPTFSSAGGAIPAVGPDGQLYVHSVQGGLAILAHDLTGVEHLRGAARQYTSGFSMRDLFTHGGSRYGYGSVYLEPVFGDGVVYYLSGSELICCGLDRRERWSVEVPGQPIGLAAGDDGVYVSSMGQGLLAYSPDGKLAWQNRGVDRPTSAPSVGPDGTVFVEGNDKLWAFEP